MGEKSRLYEILVSQKDEEDKRTRHDGDWRNFRGFYSLQRLSKGIRRSFKRIRRKGRQSKGKSLASTKDCGLDTVTRCESVDSGLDSDNSTPLSKEKSFTSDKSVQTYLCTQELDLSGYDIRKSSNLSARTNDSGVVTRISAGCLITQRIHNVPKKKVSILLPGEKTDRSIFGSHLQVERTAVVGERRRRKEAGDRPRGCVRPQRHKLLDAAMQCLISLHPTLCDTVRLIFDSCSDLHSLNSSQIGNLVFNLRSILYRDLDLVSYFEVCLFVIQAFLYKVSCILDSIPGLQEFPAQFRALIHTSELLNYSRDTFILRDTQAIYIDFWCSLVVQS